CFNYNQNGKVNEIKAEKIARVANPLALIAQQQPVYHPQNHPTHYTQNSSTRSQQAATRNREKAIVNSPQPIYDQEPSMVDENDETLKDKEIDKLMALISLSWNLNVQKSECKKQTIVATSLVKLNMWLLHHAVVRDANEKKLIQVLKIPTEHNVADLLTKSFDVTRFGYLVVNIVGMVSAGGHSFLQWFLFTSAGRVTFCWLFPIPAGDLVSAGHILFLLSDALPFDEGDLEAEFKRYLRQASDDDEPGEPVSFALVSDIHMWEIIPTEFGLSEIHVITRADGTVKRFSTLRELMYWAGRADLMVLYGLVSNKYKTERATGIGLGLWSDLRTLITAREDRDASIIWDDQDQWEIQS
nr:putative ribonuclease H-like domain-containing protein [Tanacetum cinerariifolium]